MGNPSRAYSRNPQSQTQQYQYQSSHVQQYQQPPLQVAPEIRRIDDNVIRLPRGPDGTTGFMLKR